jgi:hypothetical protein
MLSLPLTKESQATEWKTIQTVARNNNFPLILNAKYNATLSTKNQTTRERKRA